MIKTNLAAGKEEVSPDDKVVCSSRPECQSDSGSEVQDEDEGCTPCRCIEGVKHIVEGLLSQANSYSYA